MPDTVAAGGWGGWGAADRGPTQAPPPQEHKFSSGEKESNSLKGPEMEGRFQVHKPWFWRLPPPPRCPGPRGAYPPMQPVVRDVRPVTARLRLRVPTTNYSQQPRSPCFVVLLLLEGGGGSDRQRLGAERYSPTMIPQTTAVADVPDLSDYAAGLYDCLMEHWAVLPRRPVQGGEACSPYATRDHVSGSRLRAVRFHDDPTNDCGSGSHSLTFPLGGRVAATLRTSQSGRGGGGGGGGREVVEGGGSGTQKFVYQKGPDRFSLL